MLAVLSLACIEQAPPSGARVSVPAVTQHLGTIQVVTPGRLLDPAPLVSGDLHDFSGALAFADQPEDLVVATQDWIFGFTVAVLQLLSPQVRFELYLLRHNALLSAGLRMCP